MIGQVKNFKTVLLDKIKLDQKIKQNCIKNFTKPQDEPTARSK